MIINLKVLIAKLRRYDAAKKADFDQSQGFDGDECASINDELSGDGASDLADQIEALVEIFKACKPLHKAMLASATADDERAKTKAQIAMQKSIVKFSSAMIWNMKKINV